MADDPIREVVQDLFQVLLILRESFQGWVGPGRIWQCLS
jgi:hypothetical protein